MIDVRIAPSDLIAIAIALDEKYVVELVADTEEKP